MKGIGLTGAGLGGAALTAPRFHDLDEMMASSVDAKHPWFVKQREAYNPTVDVDWDQIKPFKLGNHGYNFGVKAGDGQAEKRAAWQAQQLKANAPGNSLKDIAFGAGAGFLSFGAGLTSVPWYGIEVTTPEQRGVARWQGTAEENAKLVRAAMHFYGSPRQGFLAFNQRYIDLSVQAGRIRVENTDQPSDDGSVRVVPQSCKSAIVYVVKQPMEMSNFGDHTAPKLEYSSALNIGATIGYAVGPIIQNRTQRFLKSLGYHALTGLESYNVANGVMAGLSELSRNAHNCTPEEGTLIRYTPSIVTDLPLPETTPIDAGMHKFCYECKTCAEVCPWGSIPMDTDPTWDTNDVGPNGEQNNWNRPGVKRWQMNFPKCHGCNFCDANCVFSQKNFASIHTTVRTIVAATSVFNGFFAQMDRTFGYGDSTDYEGWWNRDLSSWKHDTILGAGTDDWA
ncbi:reductive dehalogenase [Dehalogenimonas sp. THU2]|uniref:reductive dehalogenase n=1 Tax=Dehalogenimonas sp. THU2 TaxID=3151121 RepID=UPI0032184785